VRQDELVDTGLTSEYVYAYSNTCYMATACVCVCVSQHTEKQTARSKETANVCKILVVKSIGAARFFGTRCE